MCGYCMESSIFAERLAVLDPDEDYQPVPDLLSLRLQEALDWRAELRATPEGLCAPAAAVALCRWWMDRMQGVGGDALFQSGLSDALSEHLQAGAQAVVHPVGWTWLADWNGDLPDPLPLEAARAAIDAYIEDTLRIDRKRSEKEQLPGAWVHLVCALAILRRAAPDDPRLRLIAQTDPTGSIGFLGIELWLQRRAVLACVVAEGIDFLILRGDHLRNEVFASVAMQQALSDQSLARLANAVSTRTSPMMNLQADDLRRIIDFALNIAPKRAQ